MTEKERIVKILMREGFGVEGATIAADALLAEYHKQQKNTTDEPPGKWIHYDHKNPYCSICGESVDWDLDEPQYFSHCPNCGKKLEGVEKRDPFKYYE